MSEERRSAAVTLAERRCLFVREALDELDRRRELLEEARRVAEALRREAEQAAGEAR